MPTATKSNPLQAARKMKVRAEPVWMGPESDGPQGGVTQGLIGRYLCCPERFRLMVIEGLKPADRFNKSIEFGNMFHVCAENHASNDAWEKPLEEYVRRLSLKYPMDRAEVDRWHNCCRVQFPEYVKFWSEHPDVTEREPVFAEREFRVPHRLPSGRTVFLRGKWDSVDIVKAGENAGLWLQENKTKGDIDQQQLQRQVTYDLQTLVYLIALQESPSEGDKKLDNYRRKMLRGVRYNVIRRPLSGGSGSIVQKKGSKNVPAETDEEYWARVRGTIDSTGIDSKGNNYPGPSHYFMRWNIIVSQADIDRFRHQTLDPVLENLCDDFEWWRAHKLNAECDVWDSERRRRVFPAHSPRHWRMPFGVYSPLTEGNPTDMDNFLATGDRTGLQIATDLFPELTNK